MRCTIAISSSLSAPRFDDRITGRLDQFSPGSKKIHIDIDPSSINKNVKVDLGIIGDCAHVIAALLARWKARGRESGCRSAERLVGTNR